MAKGTITGVTGSQYIDVKIEWESTPDAAANTSTVIATLYYKRNTSGLVTSGTGRFYITINGQETVATKRITITEDSWVKAVGGIVTVNHNTNGSKSISISASGSMSGTTLTSTSVSGTATLDTIPRESVLTGLTCSTKYFTGLLTYKISPTNAGFFNRCIVSLNEGGTLRQIKDIRLGANPVRTSFSLALSEEELAAIYGYLPNTATGTLRFTLYSYTDSNYSTQIGEGDYREINLNIPDNDATKPTGKLLVVTDNSMFPSQFAGLIIQRMSIVQNIIPIDFEGKYGASIVSTKIIALGEEHDLSEVMTVWAVPYPEAGEIPFTAIITDSRGFQRTVTETKTVLPYFYPLVVPGSGESEIIAARCKADGTLSDSGTYLKIKAKRTYSKVMVSGEQKNYCKIQYRFRKVGASFSDWTTILDRTAAGDEIETGAMLGGVLDTECSFEVEIRAIDDFDAQGKITVNVPTEKVYMHEAASIRSFGIGEFVDERNTVSVAEDLTTKFKGKVLFVGEKWLDLGLNTSGDVSDAPILMGRCGSGCYYRVCAGENHVYVAFNAAYTYSGSPVRINAELIPSGFRPSRPVYGFCAASGGMLARVFVRTSGEILVEWVKDLSSASETTSATVSWIDGYIDYWI